jgi:AcrR family transcriptional regulator
MTSSTDNERTPLKRRVPQQVRSRGRVRRILEVAGEIVVESGVEAVSTRAIATAAGLPVASLYQYFADKEAILLALVERDIAEMDAQVAKDIGSMTTMSVRSLVETTMRAFVKVYHRRPSFVVIWFRGRTNPAVMEYCRAHNRRMARDLYGVARSAGMVVEGSDGLYAELAVEVADRIFQVAFEDSLTGDPHVIDEGIALVTAYLETHATPTGITGTAVADHS